MQQNCTREVVKINLPGGQFSKVEVYEAIHAKYDAEIIGDDLFIRVSFILAMSLCYLLFIDFCISLMVG